MRQKKERKEKRIKKKKMVKYTAMESHSIIRKKWSIKKYTCKRISPRLTAQVYFLLVWSSQHCVLIHFFIPAEITVPQMDSTVMLHCCETNSREYSLISILFFLCREFACYIPLQGTYCASLIYSKCVHLLSLMYISVLFRTLTYFILVQKVQWVHRELLRYWMV